MFEKNELEEWLIEISQFIKEPISIYLIGGGSMSFQDIKENTKDIDIVTTSKKTFHLFDKAIKSAKYEREVNILDDFYLTALAVYKKGDSRIDVFQKQVGKMLIFTNNMQERAISYNQYGNLSVYTGP